MIATRSMFTSMAWSVKTSILMRMEQALTRPNITVDEALGRAFHRAKVLIFIADLAFVSAKFVQLGLSARLNVFKVGWRVDGRWKGDSVAGLRLSCRCEYIVRTW